jgi:hypothetical protein
MIHGIVNGIILQYLSKMKIAFYNSKDFDSNLKATIHSSGKLGFTEAAIEKIGISEKKGMKIGYNETDRNEKNLYVIFTDGEDQDAFRINKAGEYYYVNTKPLFDNMQLPYKTNRISFDIIQIELEGEKVYKFLYKEKPKKL